MYSDEENDELIENSRFCPICKRHYYNIGIHMRKHENQTSSASESRDSQIDEKVDENTGTPLAPILPNRRLTPPIQNTRFVTRKCAIHRNPTSRREIHTCSDCRVFPIFS